MNKLIKKLAEQSGFHFYNMHDVDGQDLGETVEVDSWEAAEKFTRLVVRECVETLKMGKRCDPYTGEWLDTPDNAIIDKSIGWLNSQFGDEE